MQLAEQRSHLRESWLSQFNELNEITRHENKFLQAPYGVTIRDVVCTSILRDQLLTPHHVTLNVFAPKLNSLDEFTFTEALK